MYPRLFCVQWSHPFPKPREEMRLETLKGLAGLELGGVGGAEGVPMRMWCAQVSLPSPTGEGVGRRSWNLGLSSPFPLSKALPGTEAPRQEHGSSYSPGTQRGEAGPGEGHVATGALPTPSQCCNPTLQLWLPFPSRGLWPPCCWTPLGWPPAMGKGLPSLLPLAQLFIPVRSADQQVAIPLVSPRAAACYPPAFLGPAGGHMWVGDTDTDPLKASLAPCPSLGIGG